MIVAPSRLPRLRRTMLLLLSTGLAAALVVNAALAQQTKIAGTTVSLVPPAGFSRASDFAGLVNKDINASILVVELPPRPTLRWPRCSPISTPSKPTLRASG
jgi:hypothetical protein